MTRRYFGQPRHLYNFHGGCPLYPREPTFAVQRMSAKCQKRTSPTRKDRLEDALESRNKRSFCGLTTTIWFSVMKNLYVFSFDTFSTTKGGKARVCSVFRSCNELDVRSQALTLKREAMASLKTVAAPAKAPCHNSQASTLTHVSQTNSLVI